MLRNKYNKHWSAKVPPTISSLCCNFDSYEAKNFYMRELCYKYNIDPKKFSSRPTKKQIMNEVKNIKK